MTDIDYTRKSFDTFASEYHSLILDKQSSSWYNFIEVPAMTRFIKPVVKNKKVLDLGCGPGLSTKSIKSWGGDVKGCDFSRNSIVIAKKENPRVNFTICSAKKTPFRSSEFDVVTCGLMLHYVKDLSPIFKEVHRITKKKGLFIFSSTHPIAEMSVKRLLFKERMLLYIERSILTLLVGNNNFFFIKPYFNNEKSAWTMLKGMKVVTYHHTFEDIINKLNDNGFVVERLTETKPVIELKKHSLEAYQRALKYPSFIVVRARKVK